jgi:hypothetical protein
MLRQPEKRETLRRYAGFGFATAIVIAPFLGLLWGVEYGLGVMVVALALTSYLAFAGATFAEPRQARRLRILAAIQLALAGAGMIAIALVI